MADWTPADLQDYTITEFALYHSMKLDSKKARKFRVQLLSSRRDYQMRKVNGQWLIRMEDYVAWNKNALARIWRKALGQVLESYQRTVPAYSSFMRRTVKYKVA